MQYEDAKLRIACIFPGFPGGSFNVPFGEPLGLLYIAGVANSLGCETEVFIRHSQEKCEVFSDRISSFSPNILAFSIMTCHAYDAVKVLTEVKKKNKNLLSIAGGAHPTLEPEFFLQRGFDISVIGQGEIPFHNILTRRFLGNGTAGIPGSAYIMNGKIIIEPPQPSVDLDSLPLPLRIPSILEGPIIGSIGYPNPNIRAAASIVTSRGCLYNCFYCCSPLMFNGGIAWRSVEKVVEEMYYLSENFQVGFFRIDDVSFAVDSSYTLGLCEKIIQSGLEAHWYCMCNAKNLGNPDVIQAMKEAGCSLVSLGVESTNAETLEKINRGPMNESLPEILDTLCNNGIATNIFYMIGFPWHTPESILRETECLYQLNAHKIQVFISTPFPRTPFWYKVRNAVFPESYHLYDTQHLVYNHPFISADEARKLQEAVIKGFYMNPSYKKRVRAFLRRFPKYKDTFFFYWKTLPFYQELRRYMEVHEDSQSDDTSTLEEQPHVN